MEAAFLSQFNSLGLNQWVREPTFPTSGNTLDLVFTSDHDRLGQLKVLAPLPGCDHCPITFDYIFECHTSTCPDNDIVNPQRLWNKGRYSLIRRHLQAFDWDNEFAYLNANDCCQRFNNIISDLTEDFIPVKTSSHDRPPWTLRPPTSLVHRRQEAWQNYKSIRQRFSRRSSEVVAAYEIFAAANRQYRRFAISTQAEYERELIVRSKDNPKLLHSYIRKKKVGRPSIGPLKLPSGSLSDSPTEMAETFATSFAAIYTHGTPANPASYQQFDGSIRSITVTVHDVYTALSDLDPNSAMGPDGIHPAFLKSCASEVAYPLQKIFTRSLLEGCVPSDWKSSIVAPIYKKGPRYDPLNYRPISLTSVCCKTMERIVCSHLRAYLESNHLLSDNQFGFRTGRSTSDQLLLVYNSVSKHVDVSGICNVILFDFSKAFDTVYHNILLSKLSAIGIDDNLLQWISSFLKIEK